jgi:uncharacterized protein (DUF305 family)
VPARRRSGIAVPAVLLATLAPVLLSGCTGAAEPAPAAGRDAAPHVIAPGRPGEPARTLSAEEAEEAVVAGRRAGEANAADVAFVRMMIDHHEQALVMADLAARHAGDGAVRRMAERIAAAQGPEIEAMRAWLARHSEPGGDSGGHRHRQHGAAGDDAPGMATAAQLDALRAARGDAFDGRFLDLMIAHHQGAVAMATDVISGGADTTVKELATDLIAVQTAEIARMRRLS